MTAIAKLIRHTPIEALKAYFASRNAELIEPVEWSGPHRLVVEQVLQNASKFDEVTRNRVNLDAERIDSMTSEVGQTALLSVVDAATRQKMRDMNSNYQRALWLYTTDPAKFQQAADVCFFENARTARTWDGFVSMPGLSVRCDQQALHGLEVAVQSLFDEGKVCKAEVFDRERLSDDGSASRLVHVSVYREAMPNSTLVFRDRDLDLLIYRPVREVAFTYDPGSGAIEVVSTTKASRARLAQIFVTHLLGIEDDAEPLPIRRFNLARFLDPRPFEWDPQDGISSFSVKLLEVMPMHGRAFITVKPKDTTSTALAELQVLFGGADGLSLAGHTVYEAVLIVHFKPDRVNPRGKRLSVRLRHPNGCDLTQKTAKERLVGEKYLRRWGILEDVAA